MKKLKTIGSHAAVINHGNAVCCSRPEPPAPTTITIQNDKEGHTYEAYQIFAGDVSSDAAAGRQ